jgi:hypothetical protein
LAIRARAAQGIFFAFLILALYTNSKGDDPTDMRRNMDFVGLVFFLSVNSFMLANTSSSITF